MNYDLLFSFVNLSVLPAWALLILAPNSGLTQRLVHSMFYPLLLGGLYIMGFGFIIFAGHGADGGNFLSIEGVRTMFSADAAMMIAWAHYLVFDLFVGAWEARDAKLRGFRHLWLVPCLILTFMAGPAGLVLYLVIRSITAKGGFALTSSAEAKGRS
jgi:hypothetical protein